MFSLPGLLALVFVEYLRPQEYFTFLASVPLLHLATVLAILGFVLDVRIGEARPQPAPHLWLTLLFFGWCVITLVVRAREELVANATLLMIAIVIYVLVAHAVQSYRTLGVLCGLLLALSLALAGIGVDQGLSSYGCFRVGVGPEGIVFVHDGRSCEDDKRRACEAEGAEPGAEYICEKVGLLGTQSDHGRVRYRGTLQDPNELALAIGIAIPFAFAFFDRKRSLTRLLLILATVSLCGLCILYTGSRGGQVVFLAVMASYFIRRIGTRRGIIVGVLLALPILLYGGRSGGESSTDERIECWWTGIQLFQQYPLFGVGQGQFTEHHYLTAHNSLILTAAELGLPGMLLWTSIIYLSFKIPIRALGHAIDPVGRVWAFAVLSSMVGLTAGALFLSYAYKDILWIYVGLSGALYQAVRRHHPDFTITFKMRDLGLVALIDIALLVALLGLTRIKLGG